MLRYPSLRCFRIWPFNWLHFFYAIMTMWPPENFNKDLPQLWQLFFSFFQYCFWRPWLYRSIHDSCYLRYGQAHTRFPSLYIGCIWLLVIIILSIEPNNCITVRSCIHYGLTMFWCMLDCLTYESWYNYELILTIFWHLKCFVTLISATVGIFVLIVWKLAIC